MRRKHTRKFKLECVRQVATGQKRPAQICREHNLSQSVLLRWRKEYEVRGEEALQPSSREEALEARIAELERFCGKLAMICEAHEATISERELCRIFEVSRSWYYEHPSLEEKAQRDIELRDAIEKIVLEFPGYGYRRVTKEIHRRGWAVNHKLVLRV